MIENLTDWYRGEQKPIRIGAYERLYVNEAVVYSYWDGSKWSVAYMSLEWCLREKGKANGTPRQDLPWRGLAEQNTCLFYV